MQKLQTSGNYDSMQDSLLERLKKLRNIDISLEDDFKELSSRIANPFISSDTFYNYFIARKERITDMIKTYNQTIIDSLINLTSQLASELSDLQGNAKSNINSTDSQELQQKSEQQVQTQDEQISVNQEKDELVRELINAMNKAGEMMWGDIDINERLNKMNNIRNRLYSKSINDLQTLLSTYQSEKKNTTSGQLTQEASIVEQSHHSESINQINSNNQSKKKSETSIFQNANGKLLIDNLLAKCGEIYREISSKFVSSNDSKYKQDISKGLRQMEKFIWNLKYQTFAQEVFERYSKLNNAAQEIIYDDIIFQNVPMLKGMYENSTNLTNEGKKSNEPEPKAPAPVETYIGATNEDVTELIKQNKYFSLLQSIKKEDVMKYNNFIYTGYNMLVDDWYKRASTCKTYDEQHDAYFQLYEIYQNFRDYISLEKSNELREQLDSIQKYLSSKTSKNTEKDGVRYNDSKNKNSSSKKI